jgi:hypothetical protein
MNQPPGHKTIILDPQGDLFQMNHTTSLLSIVSNKQLGINLHKKMEN